jgi:hypothetical protein
MRGLDVGGDFAKLGGRRFGSSAGGIAPEIGCGGSGGVERSTSGLAPVIEQAENIEQFGGDGCGLVLSFGPTAELALRVPSAEDFGEAVKLGKSSGFRTVSRGARGGGDFDIERGSEDVFVVEGVEGTATGAGMDKTSSGGQQGQER